MTDKALLKIYDKVMTDGDTLVVWMVASKLKIHRMKQHPIVISDTAVMTGDPEDAEENE